MTGYSLRIQLLSPEKTLALSQGEVSNHNTLDAVTQMPVMGGLFDCRIFGPIRDYTCICGEIRRDRSKKGQTCPKCKVLIDQSFVRRRRTGHISLAFPVVHIWYRSIIAALLNIPPKQLENIIYCNSYIVIKSKDDNFNHGDIIDYQSLMVNRDKVTAITGGAAIKKLLERLDLHELYKNLKKMPPSRRINRRLRIVKDFIHSDNKPEWMIITVLPVLPPDLRPVLFLSNGTAATSDLNDLYANVILKNNRLKRFIRFQSPEIMLNAERMLLQKAVDCLIDNGRKYTIMNSSGNSPLKSLTKTISTKEGRLRQNLLGKRVDYSGRSHITVGPDLKLHQVGLPKTMAMELFKPFVINKLIQKQYASSMSHAKVIIEKMLPEAVESLMETVEEHPVMLNRAPTLHKLSMQAFDPVIIEGKAIQLHPLVCSGFNADFDGDQFAVHVPLSVESQMESRVLMSSVNNFLHPANGKPSMIPSQDIILGIYWLTKERRGAIGEGMLFADIEDVFAAYDNDIIEEHAKIKVRIDGQFIETTAGRVLFSEILPECVPFSEVNKLFTKKNISGIIDLVFKANGAREVIAFLDRLKDIGFKFAAKSGISLCMDDMHIPSSKKTILHETEKEVNSINNDYEKGLTSDVERYNKIIAAWTEATRSITKEMINELGKKDDVDMTQDEIDEARQFNNMFMMSDSGARGSAEQIRQVAGLRGLMSKTTGEIVEIPIKSSLKEGLTSHEYFLSCHGARKGRADGALKTANAGYFTIKLVSAGSDIIVDMHDCKTIDGLKITALMDEQETLETLHERIIGRYAAASISDPKTGRLIVERNTIITENIVKAIADASIDEVIIRSPVACRSSSGVCVLCYGHDLQTKRDVELGTAIGIIAAQSIGEPGTQLTLRTFHSGGVASGSSSVLSITARSSGKCAFASVKTIKKGNEEIVVSRSGRFVLENNGDIKQKHVLPYGAVLHVLDGQYVSAGDKIATIDINVMPVISTAQGAIRYENIIEGVSVNTEIDTQTGLERKVVISSGRMPFIAVLSGDGNSHNYYLTEGAEIIASDGSIVQPGDIIAKKPKEASKNIDITSDLNRVINLAEARSPINHAVLAPISGIVKFGEIKKKTIKITITSDGGDEKEVVINDMSSINISDGDYVESGDVLRDGVINPHDIIAIHGYHEAALYLLNEMQKVYKKQGVTINCKHFETIIKKMVGYVEITDPGDTDYISGDIVKKMDFLLANMNVKGQAATARSRLFGITQVALLSDSFMAAASFQRASSVFSKAAIQGKIDELSGIKENVMIGQKIPAGTGFHNGNIDVNANT